VSSLACPRRYSTATGSELLDDASLVIHSFFSDNFCAKPVHLCVDTRLVDDRIDARAFVTAPNALTRSVLVSFLELKTAIVASPEARVGVDAMTKALGVFDGGAQGGGAQGGAGAADVDALSASRRRLTSLLDAAAAYVDDVVEGRAPADEALGRSLADTLSAIPTVDAAGFDRAFTSALRDVLMTSYLTSITAVQMKLAERLVAVVPPSERQQGGQRR
jgi:translation initiation factor 3 subunit F